MKKTLFVTALVAVLVFAFAASAFAVAQVGNQNGGYFTWTNAKAAVNAAPDTDAMAAELAGPHSGYVINSIKCGVCHSVHGAASAGVALTKVLNAASDRNSVCVYCHAIDAAVGAPKAAMYISQGSNHISTSDTGVKKGGGCTGGCHMESPHGANPSQIPLLAKYLLNNQADVKIHQDSAAGLDTTNLWMTDSADPGYAEALTAATAYTCAGNATCHNTGAFPVMASGDKVNLAAAGATASWKTGHPVYQAASDAWSETGAQFSGKIAWNGVTGTTTGCDACHNAEDTLLGKAAFPHNQVNSDGIWNGGAQTDPTFLWMTKASDASLGDVSFVTKKDNYGATVDGVCLKCHLSTSTGPGVGVTF
jgi:predicted CXXCH cytochrome family protein